MKRSPLLEDPERDMEETVQVGLIHQSAFSEAEQPIPGRK